MPGMTCRPDSFGSGSRTPELLTAVVGAGPELEESGGRVRKRRGAPAPRADLDGSVSRLVASLEAEPFAAPEQPRLVGPGSGPT